MVIPGTCVTFVEIGWVAGVGALVLLRPHLPKALGGGGGGGIALKAMGSSLEIGVVRSGRYGFCCDD